MWVGTGLDVDFENRNLRWLNNLETKRSYKRKVNLKNVKFF